MPPTSADTKSGGKADIFANKFHPLDQMNFGGLSAMHGFDPNE